MNERPLNNPSDIVRGREQSIGPFLGSLVVLALLVIGAFYVYGQGVAERSASGGTATTTEIIIHRHAPASTATTSKSTEDAELDAIQSGLDDQTADLRNINF